MASAGKGWKQHLLQSGFPLEYEIARLLAQAGMSVDADFSFIRPDGGEEREGSVDIMSTWYSSDDEIEFTLRLLVECKFRSPHKSFLFLPDPNIDYSPITLGGTLRVVDEFSPFYVPTTAISNYESGFEFAYKGIEIFEGGAISNELRHGINQLRYAAPRLLRNDIEFQLHGHRSDIHPTFFAKILVTNADIRLIDERCSVDEIGKVDNMDEISTVLGRVILHSTYGPDFESYVSDVFSISDNTRRVSREIRPELLAAGKVMTSLDAPDKFLSNLSAGNTWECMKIGTQFFIVRKENLAELLEELKVVCMSAYEQRRETRQEG